MKTTLVSLMLALPTVARGASAPSSDGGMTAGLWVEVAKTVVSLVVGLAWPAAVVAILFIFRRTIADVVRKMARLKYGDLEVDLRHELVSSEPSEVAVTRASTEDPAKGTNDDERQKLRELALDVLEREFRDKLVRGASHRERPDLHFDAIAILDKKTLVFQVFVLGESTDLPTSSFEAVESRTTALTNYLDVERGAITFVAVCVTSLAGKEFYELEARLRRHFRDRRFSDVRIFGASMLEELARNQAPREDVSENAPT